MDEMPDVCEDSGDHYLVPEMFIRGQVTDLAFGYSQAFLVAAFQAGNQAGKLFAGPTDLYLYGA
jgi:hypothetical protein